MLPHVSIVVGIQDVVVNELPGHDLMLGSV